MSRSSSFVSFSISLALAAPAFAQSWSARVPLAGDDAIAASPGVQQKCDLARGGSQYLAVWEDARAAQLAAQSTGIVYGLATNPLDVWATRVDASGVPIDALPFPIALGSGNQENARVAWNGTSWLVVFESKRATPFTTTKGVYAVRVSAAGVVLDPTPILIDDDDGADENGPVVASDGTHWAVLWTDLVNGQDWIQGAIVSPAGQVVSKRLVLTGGVFLFPLNPSVAWAQDRYLVAFHRYTSGAPLNQYDDVYGRFLDATLLPMGADFAIGATPGAQTHAHVSSNGTSFFVAWDFQGPIGTPVATNGAVAVPGGVQMSLTGTTVFPRGAWDGAQWVVTWPGQFGTKAARVDPSGALVGSTIDVEPPPGNGWSTAHCVVGGGAGAPGESVVAWTDSRAQDVLARPLDANGNVGARSAIAVGDPGQVFPDVDGDRAHGFLVAYVSDVSSGRRVVAQRVDASGASLDAQPIELDAGGAELGTPHVAWDATTATWLVVWHAQSGAPTVARSYGRRVAADGTVLDAARVDYLPGSTPDASAMNGTFLVVAIEAPTTQTRFVRTTRVDAGTGAGDGIVRTIGNNYATGARVDAFGGRWLVAFNKSVSHDAAGVRVQAAFVDGAGVATPEFDLAAATAREHDPIIAHLNDVALVAYGDNNLDTWMRRVRADGTFVDGPNGVQLTSAPNVQFTPAVASDGNGWLAAWNDERIHPPIEGMLGDVYGTRIDASGAVLDPQGLAFAIEPRFPEGNPALAGDLGTFVLATAELDVARAATRVFVRVVDGSSSITSTCAGDGLDPNVSTPCPCANFGSAGHGCASSVNAAGALLAASGSVRVDPSTGTDTVVLDASGMPSTAGGVFLQGDAFADATFGDGVRCIGGTLLRLRTKIAAGGASRFPEPGDRSLSQRGGVVPGSGVVRGYQTYYRNAAGSFCPPETFNVTNGIRITW